MRRASVREAQNESREDEEKTNANRKVAECRTPEKTGHSERQVEKHNRCRCKEPQWRKRRNMIFAPHD